MKNSSYAIMIAAVMFAATFAGLAIIADDTEAEEAETGDYTVTFSFDGGVIVKTMAKGNTYTFSDSSISGAVKASTGYEFDKWKDANSGVIYDDKSAYTFTQDIVVVPTFKANASIVKLVYGGVKEEFTAGSTGKYVITAADMASFAKAIDANYSGEGTISAKSTLTKDGFEFKGFYAESDTELKTKIAFNALSGPNVGAGINTYVAVFTPIHDLDFYVDDVKVTTIASNVFAEAPMDPEKANYTFKGWAVDGEIVSVVKDGRIVITDEYVKALTADTDFVAVFAPVQLTLTLVVGDFTSTQPALYGQTITAPGLPDGYSSWATMAMVDDKEVYTVFDFAQPILEDMTLYAQKAEKVYTVSFVSEGVVIGGPYDATKTYTVPADPVVEGKKFVGWFVGDYKVLDIKAYIADHAGRDIVLTASFTEADAPAGPGFFQTTTGQCVIVLLVVVVLALIYAIHTNMFGLKDTLTSVKIQRVKKE